MRILVVDDDRAVRESLRRSLSFNGYSVELAQDGVEALEAIASDRPDAVVLDVMMPRLDGLEVCRQLRSTGDDLPILVLTARDTTSEKVAGLDAGADDYLPKPFALEELLARMRALLRRTVSEDGTDSQKMTFSDLTLDPGTAQALTDLTAEVLGVMESLAQRGMTMISVTHEMGFARRVADLVVFMHRGKVWEIGPTAELFADPKTAEFRQFVGSEL